MPTPTPTPTPTPKIRRIEPDTTPPKPDEVIRKHPLAKCEECPLYKVGKYVPSKLPDNNDTTHATIAFIGEAPARTEIRLGEPFVGPSGKLLNAVLNNYGIQRRNVALVNACSCHYPPDMWKSIPLSAIEACRPRLVSELEEANTTTAVLMGASAVKAVLPPAEARKGVIKLRGGPPRRTQLAHLDLTVVPTFHPAACLRNQTQFPLMLNDVGKAVARDKPAKWYEPHIVIVGDDTNTQDIVNIIQRIKKLNKGAGLIVDTESGLEKDTAFGRDGVFGNVLCIGIGPLDPTDQDTVYVFTADALEPQPLRNMMRDLLNECGIIAQNGKYDVGVLMNYLGQDEPFPLIADTMLMSYTLNEVGGIHGLKYMGQELLGCPDWEAEIKPHISKDRGFASIPQDLLHKYNAFDVHVTRLLYGYLSTQVDENGLSALNKFLLRVSEMLTLVERREMGFDLAYSMELGTSLKVELDRLEQEIPINPRSPKQIKEYLAEFNIQVESTDADHLKMMIDDPKMPTQIRTLASQILESRGHTKMNSNYVTGLQAKLSPNHTIRTTYLVHGTTTGRLSSRNPNLQNVPRGKQIKKQFIPKDPQKVFVQVDFSQAELRTLTWLAKEEAMRDLFNDPTRDVFVELCRSMFPEFDTWDDTQKKEIRTLIKTFAYGISYGRTAQGIAADPDFQMSVVEATRHMTAFQKMIPNIMKFQQGIIETIHAGKDLINPFGRHRRFYLITDANQASVHNEAMSFLPQSTASDICLEAACRLSAQGIEIVNLIHDAILIEALPDEAEDIANLMNKVMCGVADEVTGGYVDFATDYKIGPTWADV